ncbi:hypothetical protein GH714_026856 [Hevea brasiliensis]|uniref:DUF2828 domain-containing protein n=1 Tax=Hevea brasiliensis TaxID=3981 RepID=A0A6A6M541_HEVBR|nr:hypothetical protein GH714_026856 [Hevea brasiliensis]
MSYQRLDYPPPPPPPPPGPPPPYPPPGYPPPGYPPPPPPPPGAPYPPPPPPGYQEYFYEGYPPHPPPSMENRQEDTGCSSFLKGCKTHGVSDPFMDLMVANFNEATVASMRPPPMGHTEKSSPTYLSSGNPCLDFFFHVVPNTPPDSIRKRLHDAWQQNPLTTLKLICNLRGVRGTGKSDKEGFYAATLWLHEFHPKTLACYFIFCEFWLL